MTNPDELYYETLRKLIEAGYDIRSYIHRARNSHGGGMHYDYPIIDCSISVSVAQDDKGDLNKIVETRDTLSGLLGDAFEIQWDSINGSFDIIHDKFVVRTPVVPRSATQLLSNTSGETSS